MDVLSAKEIAKLSGMSTRRIQHLCEQGKIEGVTRLGKMWAIPANAKKPPDSRLKQNR